MSLYSLCNVHLPPTNYKSVKSPFYLPNMPTIRNTQTHNQIPKINSNIYNILKLTKERCTSPAFVRHYSSFANRKTWCFRIPPNRSRSTSYFPYNLRCFPTVCSPSESTSSWQSISSKAKYSTRWLAGCNPVQPRRHSVPPPRVTSSLNVTQLPM
jgi:hypothetical protein